MIWKKEFTVEELNTSQENMLNHLGIKFTESGDDYIQATMPVDGRTHQPFGLLHGGASVALAESVGSLAGYLCLENPRKVVVGQEINANHLRGKRSGVVTATAKPVHLGKTSQVWSIEIKDEQDKMITISRLTLAVIDMP